MRRVLLLSLVAALLAPALASAAPPRFTLEESASAASSAHGEAVETTLYVNASAPATVSFFVQDADLDVSLGTAQGNALPGAPLTSLVTVRTLNATLGAHVVRLGAREMTASALGGASDPVFVDFTVTIVGVASAPVVAPRSLDLEAPAGGSIATNMTVRNPDEGPRTYAVNATLPRGWSLGGPTLLTIPANTTWPVRFMFVAASNATNGTGAIAIGGASVGLTLRVKASEPGPPPPDPTPTPSPSPSPSPNPTPDPTPSPTPPTTADPTPAPTPAPRVSLLVEPAVLTVLPGGRANATIVVSSSTDVRLTLHLQLPSGFSSDLGARVVDVAAGVDAIVRVQLHEVGGAKPNSSFDARAVAEGADVPPGAFRILVQAQPPAGSVAVLPTRGAPSAVVLAGAGVVGAASVAAFTTRRRWILGLALLYTRLKPQAVLEQPQRARIMDALRTTPGASFGELQRGLGLANGALRHHLDLLEKSGAVVSVAHGQQRRFFVAGAPRAPLAPRLPERALEAVRTRGPMTQTQLAQELGVSRQALHYHVQRLARAGKLKTRVVGRELVIEAEPFPSP